MLGTRIGNYTIERKLAAGGMGEVFVARHEMMDREAVVKVLLPEMSAQLDVVKRFFNEARAATSIQHPGIVEVFDVGTMADGRAYIVMERLRGESLAARLAAGRPTVEQAMSWTRQLAGALGAAHDRGIVHRDLKPDNLFLVPDPEVEGGERVKVLDFGIAKLAAEKTGSLMTAAGSIFGTPAYMAPEQCTSAAAVDQRADLYAVGCLLYEFLTGQPPFGQGGIELLAAHLRDVPVPPSHRLPAGSIPPRLDAVCVRLLAKQPAQRYASCAELIVALDGGVVRSTGPVRTPTAPGDATSARPLTTHTAAAGERAIEAPRRAHWIVPALAIAAVAGVVALVVARGGGDEPRGAAAPAPPIATPAASPDATPAVIAAPKPALVVGERVMVRRGPVEFAVFPLQALKHDLALVDEQEVVTTEVAPLVGAAEAKVGDAVVFPIETGFGVGIVEHVRIDGQLTVKPWRGDLVVRLSPPSAMKPGHIPIDAGYRLPEAWAAGIVEYEEKLSDATLKLDETRRAELAADRARRDAAAKARASARTNVRSSAKYRACYKHCREMEGTDAYCVPNCEAEASDGGSPSD